MELYSKNYWVLRLSYAKLTRMSDCAVWNLQSLMYLDTLTTCSCANPNTMKDTQILTVGPGAATRHPLQA